MKANNSWHMTGLYLETGSCRGRGAWTDRRGEGFGGGGGIPWAETRVHKPELIVKFFFSVSVSISLSMCFLSG